LTTWPVLELIPPVFSADGSEVYFVSERQVTTYWFDLWRVPLAGGEPTRITRTGQVLGLCWQSRRPTEVLVLTNVEARVTTALMRVRPDGTLRPVWDRTTARCGTVSPTSDSVAVLTSVAAGEHQAMLVPLNGGPGRRILEANQFPVAWSPDGRQLLFRYTVGQPYDLGILDLASGSTRRITSTPASEFGTEWSADGTTLVFIRQVSDYGITTADLSRLLARPE
jgi:Tol biopolymer transport system component